jgi:hypothetical protein
MRPPLWGNFVACADLDLLSFAWLYSGGMRVPGYSVSLSPNGNHQMWDSW